MVRLGIVDLASQQAGQGWVFRFLSVLSIFQRARAHAGFEFVAKLPRGPQEAGAFDLDGNYYTGPGRALTCLDQGKPCE